MIPCKLKVTRKRKVCTLPFIGCFIHSFEVNKGHESASHESKTLTRLSSQTPIYSYIVQYHDYMGKPTDKLGWKGVKKRGCNYQCPVYCLFNIYGGGLFMHWFWCSSDYISWARNVSMPCYIIIVLTDFPEIFGFAKTNKTKYCILCTLTVFIILSYIKQGSVYISNVTLLVYKKMNM